MRNFLLFSSLCLSIPLSAPAVAEVDMIDTLERITKTVCIDIPLDGGKISKEVTGEARVGLSKLFSGLVDAGMSVDGSFSSDEYVNVLHEQLDGRVSAQQQCQLQVYTDFAPLLNDWASRKSGLPAIENTINNTGTGNANAAGQSNSVTVNN